MTSAPTDFYPRPPRGGRRLYRHSQADVVNFYPRPPQGGRPLQFPLVRTDDVISIHALREEGDLKGQKKVVGRYLFLSTPSARRATDATTTGSNTGTFLSTPSARRATRAARSCKSASIFLSTPSARRATTFSRHHHVAEAISIHALREEGDVRCKDLILGQQISIHALREEGDSPRPTAAFLSSNFYPRPPRGGRRRR